MKEEALQSTKESLTVIFFYLPYSHAYNQRTGTFIRSAQIHPGINALSGPVHKKYRMILKVKLFYSSLIKERFALSSSDIQIQIKILLCCFFLIYDQFLVFILLLFRLESFFVWRNQMLFFFFKVYNLIFGR